MSAQAAYTCGFCGTVSAGDALSCPACGSPVDVERVVSPGGWEELPAISDMARLQVGRSYCQVEGTYVPVADWSLAEGDGVYFGHHVLLWMEPGTAVSMLPMAGAWNRLIGGLPIAMMQAKGPGRIAFSHDEPGEMVAVPLGDGRSVDVREGVFVAATSSVGYSFFDPRLYVTLAVAEKAAQFPLGMMMDRFASGGRPGLLLLHAHGNVFVRRLAEGETVLVHPSALLFKDSSVVAHLHAEFPAGSEQVRWGSGTAYLWLRLHGPGRVAIRSAYPTLRAFGVSSVREHSPWTEQRYEVRQGALVSVTSPAVWHYAVNGETRGPTTLAHVQGMLVAGRVPDDVAVWTDGMRDWVPGKDVRWCSRCKQEVPTVVRRGTTWREWIWALLPICIPFLLLGLVIPFRRCTRCRAYLR